MTTTELLSNLKDCAEDFMQLAMDTEGVESGLAAECSQRLQDVHSEFERRFRNNGLIE